MGEEEDEEEEEEEGIIIINNDYYYRPNLIGWKKGIWVLSADMLLPLLKLNLLNCAFISTK